MAEHIVKTVDDLDYHVPSEFADRSQGYTRDPVVAEAGGAVQMGFEVSQLEPGGHVDAHVHSFEETLYVTEGEVVVDTPEGSYRLVAGDYGLLPVGMTHAFRNMSGAPVTFSR
jgi:quercetin dioxygenase-like cupin family protein